MKQLLATCVLLAATTSAAAQWLSLATPGIPRTPDGKPELSAPVPRAADGHPDLSGLWARGLVSGSIFDLTKVHDWARVQREERQRSFFDDEPFKQCLPNGPAYTVGGDAGRMRRIVQGPTVIAFLHDDLTYRQIFVDGRSLESNPNPIWMGYSVGRWDGDTLVVESNGFNDKTWLHNRGLSHTERLRVTERYRRVNFGNMQVEVTYEDPGTFDSPLHATIAMGLVVDDEMLETVCNEASEGRKHWVGEIADAEATAVEVAPETLAKYVGTYRGYWGSTLTTVDVALENGALSLWRNGAPEKFRLLPQSETTFECSCGLGYIFTTEGSEMATEVAEVHVTGGWAFKRVP